MRPYWAGTSSNDILMHLLEMSDRGKVRQEIEGLLEGHPVVKSVSEMTSFKALRSNPDSIWNTMLFTGYLKPREPVLGRETAELVLPNHELKVILANCIDEWMDRRYAHMNWQPLAKAFMEGDTDAAEQSLNALLITCISYYDYRESYYHGFLTGLLNGDGMSYTAWSNRKSGSGRSDIMAMRNDGLCGCVIEIKIAKNMAELPTACEAAIRQLNTLDYATELLGRGCRKLFSYGVAFWKKRCLVKSAMVTE